jgi:ribonuclease Z
MRELVVLGTASQVPTRSRNHNGYLLRWDHEAILFDPGEGTQRQLTHAGVAASTIHRICITHAHGDHCLGLPGVLQRLSLDGIDRPVDVHFPEEAAPTVARLRSATPYEDRTPVRLRPTRAGEVHHAGAFDLRAVALSHSLPTLGWRVQEPDGWRMLPDRLVAAGVHGPARSELRATGTVRTGGRLVRLEEVAVARPGQSVAVVMDTRDGDGARELAAGVDLLLIEATFLGTERAVAEEAGHLTAAQAARIGGDAGARRTVLTHFSQRYPSLEGHLAEARRAAPGLDVLVARDLDRIAIPPRRCSPAGRAT